MMATLMEAATMRNEGHVDCLRKKETTNATG